MSMSALEAWKSRRQLRESAEAKKQDGALADLRRVVGLMAKAEPLKPDAMDALDAATSMFGLGEDDITNLVGIATEVHQNEESIAAAQPEEHELRKQQLQLEQELEALPKRIETVRLQLHEVRTKLQRAGSAMGQIRTLQKQCSWLFGTMAQIHEHQHNTRKHETLRRSA